MSPSRLARGRSSASARVEPGPLLAVERGAPEPGLLEPRARVRNQHVIGHLHDVLVVHPFELLGVEHGVAAADALEVEALDEVVAP